MPRGGKRNGAGAPRGNLNHLVHGRTSKQIHEAIENALSDQQGSRDVMALLRKYHATEC